MRSNDLSIDVFGYEKVPEDEENLKEGKVGTFTHGELHPSSVIEFSRLALDFRR